jgi:hypothetical protein
MMAILAAPSLFACKDCVNGTSCVTVSAGFRFCEFFPDGTCEGLGTCSSAAAPLQAEYRVAAVHVIESGKPLPPAKDAPKTPAVLAAAKR